MRVAIVHYHLRTGGVTRVIRNAIEALAPHDVQLSVVCGEPPDHQEYWPGLVVDECLAYHSAGSRGDNIESLARTLSASVSDALGGPPDVWHIHNHCLGKNAELPLMVRWLAESGAKLLLQPHDFAEDGRPANYAFLRQYVGRGNLNELGRVLYPVADHVHYAPLNGRDAALLQSAGMPTDHVHVLHNAAAALDAPREDRAGAEGRPLFLYPTRAIRRKNLGEFFLWSVAHGEDALFATTLAPQNPAEHERYNRWVEFASEEKLGVELEWGKRSGLSFSELVASSRCLVTTSVAEGFGLAFLEPWLMGKPLAGRNLPEITKDFTGLGLDLDGLYDRLDIPAAWIDLSEMRERMAEAMSAYYKAYGETLSNHHLEEAVASMLCEEMIDFGRLDEGLQRSVISRVKQGRDLPGHMRPAQLLDVHKEHAMIEKNRAIAQQHFSLEAYGATLHSLYQTVCASTPGRVDTMSAERFLQAFLDPKRFCLLRT